MSPSACESRTLWSSSYKPSSSYLDLHRIHLRGTIQAVLYLCAVFVRERLPYLLDAHIRPCAMHILVLQHLLRVAVCWPTFSTSAAVRVVRKASCSRLNTGEKTAYSST
jgi:hypothetical protein